MAAPAISLSAGVTTTKYLEVAWEFDEFLDDFKFVETAEQAEVMDFFTEICL